MKRSILFTVLVVASLPALSYVCSKRQQNDRGQSASWASGIFGKGLSLLVGQRFEREEDSPAIFKQYALADESNDDIAHLTVQQIIERSGYETETHRCLADDGYITELIRIINPLADQRKLKGPPIMLLQGGISDQSIWIWASTLQHHPEKFPRTLEQDGPISSWNRSLGFVLANNGYDVWLVGTRGSNEGNRGHLKLKHKANWLEHEPRNENGTNLTDVDMQDQDGLLDKIKYWNYTMDELANYELPRQIDTVKNITGWSKVTLVPISLSSMISRIFIAAHPEYLPALHNVVVLAPIINNLGTNNVLRNFHRGVCRFLPSELGNIFYSELLFSKLTREILLKIGKRKDLRYSLIKALTLAYAGPSSKYQTLLEPAVYGKILQPTSFKQVKHYCQQVLAGSLQTYDFGPMKNQQLYGTLGPKKYDLAGTDFGNWMVVSGGNDKFATIRSVKQYMDSSKRAPIQHIFIKRYNHLDIIAGADNDVQVNLPILAFLDRFHLQSKSAEESVDEN